MKERVSICLIFGEDVEKKKREKKCELFKKVIIFP